MFGITLHIYYCLLTFNKIVTYDQNSNDLFYIFTHLYDVPALNSKPLNPPVVCENSVNIKTQPDINTCN